MRPTEEVPFRPSCTETISKAFARSRCSWSCSTTQGCACQGGYVGVDVFFVLSGFLITGLLLSAAAEQGRVSLGDFYVRRARRILPAAVLTLVVTDIVAYQLLNFVRAREAVVDSVWAAFFTANVHFAADGKRLLRPDAAAVTGAALLDALGRGAVLPRLAGCSVAGPVRCPRGVAPTAKREPRGGRAPAGADRRRGRRSRVPRCGRSAPPGRHRLPRTTRRSRAPGSWRSAPPSRSPRRGCRACRRGSRSSPDGRGLRASVVAAVAFSASTAFPGYAAMLPTVGAALVIAAGIRSACPGVRRAAFSRFRRSATSATGRTRFYLWHWPVLVIATEYAGHELSTGVRLVLLAGAFLLSMLSYALFENPIRHMTFANAERRPALARLGSGRARGRGADPRVARTTRQHGSPPLRQPFARHRS